MKYPGLLGPAYQSISPLADSERCVNLYLEKNETPNAPSQYVMVDTPGFTSYVTGLNSSTRALYTTNGTVPHLFAVAGTAPAHLYDVVGPGLATDRGSVGSSSDTVTTMAWNGPAVNQLLVANGGAGYLWNLTTVTLTNPLATGCDVVAYLDGYFLALNGTTGLLQLSNLLDGTTWNPTHVALRSAQADPWRWLIVVGQQLWLMGDSTSEVWYDAGAPATMPFALIPGAVIPVGIAAGPTAAVCGGILCWLGLNAGGQLGVYRQSGPGTLDAVEISTPPVAHAIRQYTYRSGDASAFSYETRGHVFYQIVFPTIGRCFVYDLTTGLWHERAYYNSGTGLFEAPPIRVHAYGYNGIGLVAIHLVGGTGTTLFTMSEDVFTDFDGSTLRRVRQTPRLSVGRKRVFVSRIELTVDPGCSIALETSQDGGTTFGPSRTVAATSANSATWRQCGSGYDRVDRFTMTDAASHRISDGEIEMTVGRV